jgi:hypothetical protein
MALHPIFRLGAKLTVAGLLAFRGLVTNAAESSKEQLPPGAAIHLKRLKDGSRTELFQNSLNLTPGGDYKLTFWARASGAFKLTASTKLSQPPWAFFGLRNDVELTPEWREYTLKFKADGAVPEHTRITFGFIAPAPADVWLADIQVSTLEGTDPVAEHIVANARFEDDLEQWYA